ncbi:MAG: ATP-dependent dethiobiotin synthetase BioD [Pirellulaceae bacterium]|nr:MAG: ATP-dependent dethiobiotin synthetase BioD [Pirellulaceae bacterium]
MKGVFVLGSDTGVGKTFCAVRILRTLSDRGIRVGAYKPVASGFQDHDAHSDPAMLWDAIGRMSSLERVCPQRFSAPLAPPQAARWEGRQVELEVIREGMRWWHKNCDWLLIEGAGGVLSPITEDLTCADLALEFQQPVLLVVRNRLGAVNQALLSLTALCARGVPCCGILLNRFPEDRETEDPSLLTNAQWIQRFQPDVPIFTSVDQWCTSLLAGEVARTMAGGDMS